MNKQEKVKDKLIPEKYFQGKDLIMAKAIMDSNIDEIEKLIRQEHYSINARGNGIIQGREQQFTYLNYAVLIGNIKSAEKLLELDADVNLVALDGEGPLGNMNMASGARNKLLIDLLLKYKVNLNNPLVASPLNSLLIGNEEKSLIELMMKNGADVNHQNYIDGSTPLLTALNIGKIDYVNYFLDNGANPLLLDSSGNSVSFLVQKEVEEGRLSGYGLEEYNKLLERFKNEFNIRFPLKINYRKSLEEGIARYENLTKENKELLGVKELNRMETYRELLVKEVDLLGRPID